MFFYIVCSVLDHLISWCQRKRPFGVTPLELPAVLGTVLCSRYLSGLDRRCLALHYGIHFQHSAQAWLSKNQTFRIRDRHLYRFDLHRYLTLIEVSAEALPHFDQHVLYISLSHVLRDYDYYFERRHKLRM